MKKTLYQKMRTVKAKVCEGKATLTDFNTAAAAYKSDAVSKGNKSPAEADKTVSAVKSAGCPIGSAKVSGAKSTKGKKAVGKAGKTGKKAGKRK